MIINPLLGGILVYSSYPGCIQYIQWTCANTYKYLQKKAPPSPRRLSVEVEAHLQHPCWEISGLFAGKCVNILHNLRKIMVKPLWCFMLSGVKIAPRKNNQIPKRLQKFWWDITHKFIKRTLSSKEIQMRMHQMWIRKHGMLSYYKPSTIKIDNPYPLDRLCSPFSWFGGH
jgi:hypothetical protein